MNHTLRLTACVWLFGLTGAGTISAQVGNLVVSEGPWVAPESERVVANPFPADAASLEYGEQIYRENCLSCHGIAGGGDGPATQFATFAPRDLADPEFQGASTDGEWHWKISTGRPPMNPYEEYLDPESIWHVINYIRTLERKPDPMLAFKNGVMGQVQSTQPAPAPKQKGPQPLKITEEEIEQLMIVDNGRPMVMLMLGGLFFSAGLLALVMEMLMARRSGDPEI